MSKFQVEFWAFSIENFEGRYTITTTALEKSGFDSLTDMLYFLKRLQVPYENLNHFEANGQLDPEMKFQCWGTAVLANVYHCGVLLKFTKKVRKANFFRGWMDSTQKLNRV